jgi:hypothetical protein
MEYSPGHSGYMMLNAANLALFALYVHNKDEWLARQQPHH